MQLPIRNTCKSKNTFENILTGINKVIEVLESYINKKSNERNNTRYVEDSLAQGEIPTGDEIEAIYREVAKSREEIPENLMKEAVERKFARQDRKLRGDWWKITKRNLIEWSKKG